MKIAVIICAFGLLTMTDATVDDVARENDIADIYVVDNAGTYGKRAREHVFRPPENLGWLRGSNKGVELAAASGYDGYLLLNNDTRLSPGFVAGMAKTMAATGAGIVAPCYDDDALEQQHCGYFGPAAEYQPTDRNHEVPFVDGTALLLSDAAMRKVGLLDEESFGNHGWGADIDLSLRVHQAGFPVLVTEASYCNHLKEGSFDPDAVDQYRINATAEMDAGMRAKWGPRWRQLAHMPGSEDEADGRPLYRRALSKVKRTLLAPMGDRSN